MQLIPRPISILILALLPLLAGRPAAALGPEDAVESRARVVPPAIPPGSSAELRATVVVGPAFHLYEESCTVGFELPAGGGAVGATAKPRGEMKIDSVTGEKMRLYEGTLEFSAELEVGPEVAPGSYPVRVLVGYQACTERVCFFPRQDTLAIDFRVDPAAPVPVPTEAGGEQLSAAPERAGGAEYGAFARILGKNLWAALGMLWIFGLVASFTPCVLPMIPITVRIITTTSGGDRTKGVVLSVVYVLGIAAMYVTLGVSAGTFGGLFGAYLGNPWVIWSLVAVFAVLGLSSFGFYKLQLPGGLQTRLSTAGGGASAFGVFLMGLAGGLIAAPCVGPVLAGLILWIGQEGSPALGALYMGAFSLGFGTLFLALGAGANAAMPTAGAWMVGVERVLGTLLFAGALYFLEQVVEAATFYVALGVFLVVLGRWMALSSEDSETPFLLLRSAFGKLVGAAGIFAVLGTFAHQGWLLPRPLLGVGGSAVVAGHPEIAWQAGGAAEIDAAMASGGPVIIDFTADWCIACKELDKLTFSDPAVVAEARRFTALKVDCTRSADDAVKEVQRRFQVSSLPTVLLVDSQGRIAAGETVRGFVDAEELLRRMRTIH